MATRYRLRIDRPQYKFSCAHMTVFPDGSKERLHGHNYTLALTLEVSDVSFAKLIPFDQLKRALAALCEAWRERVLVAEENPFFERLLAEPGEYAFRLCGARYVLPHTDVLALPLDNITVETLASYVAAQLKTSLHGVTTCEHVHTLEVTVEETPGQGATCILACTPA